MKKKKILMKFIGIVLVLGMLAAGSVFAVNAHIKNYSDQYILTPDNIDTLGETFDCALVLGCKVKADGRPSDMLHDRLQRGVELYNDGVVPKLLMSGDHGQTEYDEVNTMKQFAIDEGIASCDVFMDHAGFSTYESMYRTRDVFDAKKIVIVTQKYHLYRAIFIARKLGIEAYGVPADYHIYAGQSARDTREILARYKDFFNTIIKPNPTYLGDLIPISGNGDDTND